MASTAGKACAMAKVAVVGVGMIGSGVAGALVDGGFDVAVYDVDPAAVEAFQGRATAAATPAEAAADADALVVAVFDDAQARTVLTGPDGAFGSLPAGAVVLVLSTITMATLDDLAKAGAESGVHVLDCGVTGGPAAAAKGRLVSMVGGGEEAVARVRPVVEAFSSRVVHMGGPGTGMRAKLIRNHMQYTVWAAADEARQLAEASGIEVAKLREVVVAGDELTGGPTALMGLRPAPDMMRGAAAMAHKDLRASMALAEEVGADVPVARLVEPEYHRVFGLEEYDADAEAGAADQAAPEQEDARTRGLRMMSAVYSLPMSLEGASSPYLDLTVEHLFGEIWTRPGLDIKQRRLLTIGVLAALGKDDVLEIQFSSAMERGELTGDQLREVVVHLAHYVGWPLTSGLGGLVEKLVRKQEAAEAKSAEPPADPRPRS
ncbi:NAD(P)-binding domain-containing protein [Yinghuangia sp. YIM S09857]|uniref:NAD(P)-binding domain-containing protein n=1 Tax=Yinghuangia sp. YIM S09857 TaxID=3436929 RepID=UPI003F5356D2